MKLRKTKLRILSIICLTLITLVGCKETKKEKVNDTPEKITEITLEKLENSPEYATASLKMTTPSDTVIKTVGETAFNFEVNNYELGALTQSKDTALLANSAKGQHIHFILNNEPYSAHYEPTFKKDMPNGVHHLVAFLSRSYHESVKNENAVVVKKLIVGEDTKDDNNLDINAPTLIYSRPKGEYSGKDTENLLLDFFVLNTQLSENGTKVRATINEKEFIITEWAPQVIKGLPKGKVFIKLELIDAEGNLIPGPFNSVDRTVTLKK
ncbi:hypothetical protein H0I29_05680 [Polaribacter sp. R2A056_3_33]|uniref:hypothetical protein n=1 Tax=Polaribacter sp. R2A056_3_33 TaxID=2745563 RepID=UPI001C4E8D6E|nr:hypothetical protein [Polaribacter sp. R2A056_3_33]QXP71573.1 hypothetical protein H0I29_05680 [Polaribacter sp. R2A056_3_33]